MQVYGKSAERPYGDTLSDVLREWQYGAWMCNRTDDLSAITAELQRRGESSHPFFGGDAS